ncbi:MAG: hypothetical protein AAGF47_08170 [Planctomycetota bacterium]
MFRSTAIACALMSTAAHASAQTTLNFDALAHGQMIVPSLFASSNVTIEAENFRVANAMPIAFDTTLFATADPDLTGPPWGGGNLPQDMVLGNVIIVPENLVDANNDGIVDSPDDEGARPAGDLTFRFAEAIDSFGFDVVDIEGVVQELTTVDFYVGGALLGTLDFADLTTPGADFYDPTISFGNNSINRVAPVTAADFGGTRFDTVIIRLGGSGAFDNIVTTIPAPTSGALLVLSGLVASRRRR